MKKYLLLFPSLLLLLSCSHNKNGNAGNNSNADSLSKESNPSFIPVTAILQNEISKLDSLPVTILQIKTINKKDDSSWLKVAEVKPLLQSFLTPVIEEKNMLGLFKEAKFNDQSTEAITFMYDPKATLPDTMALRRWDVYFDPEKNSIQRVYMIKQVKENGVSATQQLTWLSGKWAKIVIINNDKNAANPVISETKWVWDLNE